MEISKTPKKPPEIIPTGTVPADQMSPFLAMEKADEDAVLAELRGEALEVFVYSFQDKEGKVVTGLSLPGVRETVRTMNARRLARIRISPEPPQIEESEMHWQVAAYAEDQLNGGGAWGIKRQSKRFGGGKLNEFALEQALSKAQRNALRALIPEIWVKVMIQQFLEEKKGASLAPEGPRIDEKEKTRPVTPTKLKAVEALGEVTKKLALLLGQDYKEMIAKDISDTYDKTRVADLSIAQIRELTELYKDTIGHLTKSMAEGEARTEIRETLGGRGGEEEGTQPTLEED